jgi:aspartyl-tRNA synthetase
MYRSHSCGELRETHIGQSVTLAGWVQKTRDKGFVVWVDIRDRYGLTQLVFDEERTAAELLEKARNLGREFVIQAKGTVIERASKNSNIPTGNIEVLVTELNVLNSALTPPFTIENENGWR